MGPRMTAQADLSKYDTGEIPVIAPRAIGPEGARYGARAAGPEMSPYIPPAAGEPRLAPRAPAKKAAAHVKKRAKAKKKGASTLSLIANLVFWVGILAVLFISMVYSTHNKSAKDFLGFSYFTVLSGSMQREIPKGSLVVTEKIDPNLFEIGDDLTYLREDNTTVTHRVVDIIENYNDSGARGFVMKGLENPSPDTNVVYAANVVGKVIFHVAELGFMLSYISENLTMILLILIAFIAVSIGMGVIFSEQKKEDVKPKRQSGAARGKKTGGGAGRRVKTKALLIV